jgi:hypothetical protein
MAAVCRGASTFPATAAKWPGKWIFQEGPQGNERPEQEAEKFRRMAAAEPVEHIRVRDQVALNTQRNLLVEKGR